MQFQAKKKVSTKIPSQIHRLPFELKDLGFTGDYHLSHDNNFQWKHTLVCRKLPLQTKQTLRRKRHNYSTTRNFPFLFRCWSSVGKKYWRVDYGQEVSLGSGCNHKGTIMHEIMHAIGFWHEQSRPDRNQYVEVLWENILDGMVILRLLHSCKRIPWKPAVRSHNQAKIVTYVRCSGEAHNFNKYDRGRVDTLQVPYDYDSIMHYGKDGFSKNGKPTLRSIKDPARALGQRNGFTQIDIQEINSLYECSSKSHDFKYCQKIVVRARGRRRLLFIWPSHVVSSESATKASQKKSRLLIGYNQ